MRFLLIALFISTTLLAQTTRNGRYTDARWVCQPDTAAVAIEKGSINVSTGSKYYAKNMPSNSEYKVDGIELGSVNTYQRKYEWEEKSVEIVYVEGEGRDSATWNRYYNEGQKVSALEEIKGIGNSRAKTLVNKNVFNTKPRSWGEFINRLNDAQQRYDMPNLVNDVKQYTDFNKDLLDYAKKRMEKVTWVAKSEWRSQYSKVAQYKQIDLRVELSIAALNRESEALKFVIGCDSSAVAVYTSANYYDFSYSVNRDDYDFKGARKKVTPSNFINAAKTLVNGKFAMNINSFGIDQEVINDLKDNKGTMTISGNVIEGEKSWKSKGTSTPFTVSIDSFSAQTVQTQVSVSDTENYKADFKIQLNGSTYFNNNNTSSKTLK